LKTKAAKTASEIDRGSFILAKIQCQASQPVSFTTSDGDRVRIWTSDRKDRKGEEVFWRVNLNDLKKIAEKRCGFSEPREAPTDVIRDEANSQIPLTRLKPNPPARDPSCVQRDTWPRPWGYKIRVYIEAEKELQVAATRDARDIGATFDLALEVPEAFATSFAANYPDAER
jgi:hypothetical protein